MSNPPPSTDAAQPSPGHTPPHHSQMQRAVPHTAVAAQAHRELYWQNVIREMLSALAVAAAESGGRLGSGAADKATGSAPIDDMFDGRLAVVTRLGQRIAIADVVPLFACSVPGNKPSSNDRHLSVDVQCTIFQIHTPNGEVHTIPVHEIVAFHSLSEKLISQLEDAARAHADAASNSASARRPFGFAAFTSLAASAAEESES